MQTPSRSLLFVVGVCLALACGPPLASGLDADGKTVVVDTALSHAEDCGPGTSPRVGQTRCVPVGWTDCPPGFRLESSGWGCVDISPATACTGATREALGEVNCTPVGDCAAPFPPPGSTHFVDPLAVVDATHFRSIGAALSAAPAGALIAVGPGRYVEGLAFTRPVTLVGKCPAEVEVTSAGGRDPGLLAQGVTGVEVRGLTLTGHAVGAFVDSGSQVTVSDCVLHRNRELGAYVFASTFTLQRSVVRDTLDVAGQYGAGLYLEDGASVVVSDSTLTGNKSIGLYLASGGAPTRATVSDSMILNTRVPPGATISDGYGVRAAQGSTVELVRSVLAGNDKRGLGAQGTQTTVSLTQTVIRDTRYSGTTGFAYGVLVTEGAQLAMTDCALSRSAVLGLLVSGVGSLARLHSVSVVDTQLNPIGAYGRGLNATEGARLELFNSAVVGSHEVGLFIDLPGSTASVSESLVGHTLPNIMGGFGNGVVAQHGARVELSATALLDNLDNGLLVVHSGSEGRVTGSLVLDTRAQDSGPAFGNGVLVNHATLQLTGSVVRRSAGVGVLFTDAQGTVDGALIADNVIGIHFQEGTTPEQVEAVSAVRPHVAQVSSSTVFRGNQARAGSGVYALPPGFD